MISYRELKVESRYTTATKVSHPQKKKGVPVERCSYQMESKDGEDKGGAKWLLEEDD